MSGGAAGQLRVENLELLSILKELQSAIVYDIVQERGKDDYGTRRMLKRLKGLGYVEESQIKVDGKPHLYYSLTKKGEQTAPSKPVVHVNTRAAKEKHVPVRKPLKKPKIISTWFGQTVLNSF